MTAAEVDLMLFRPHCLGDIMTGVAKGWSVDRSVTCKRRLIKMCREFDTGRREILSNKYLQKGILGEEDGITLLSRFRKKMLQKNTVRQKNSYFSGECDIQNGDEIIDVKCSWSLQTLPHPAVDDFNKDYEYQGLAYMDLYGATTLTIAYCLINAPAKLIDAEKKKLWYELGQPEEEPEEHYAEIEKNMIFDMPQFKRDYPDYELSIKDWKHDISVKYRVIEYKIDFDQAKIDAIYARVKECRMWIKDNLI